MSTIDQVVEWIGELRPVRVVAFTGAGISAESGVPTFRGASGLWKNYKAEDLATPAAFERDPKLVWEWYEWRRSLIRGAEPNAAHLALASIESEIGDAVTFDLVTQNVDGLHERSGSRRIHELHGNMFRARCVKEGRRMPLYDPLHEIPPRCDCGAMLRPDVVWFGEALPAGVLEAAALAARQAELFLVIGTSGVVYPAAGLVEIAPRESVVIVNPEEIHQERTVRFSLREKATVGIPPLVGALLEVHR